MNFDNKTIWITGASSGIGAGLARAFATEGAALILSGRREQALEEVVQQCRTAGAADVLALPFETTDFDALPALVSRADGWRDGIDMLVNNAGISQRSLVMDTQMEVYRSIMEVDYFAPVALTKLVLPGMLARGGGTIAINSSLAGKLGSKLRSGYSSAKHALLGFYDSLRAELHEQGIRVAVILPGYVQSQVSVSALTGDGSEHGIMDSGQASAISADDAAKVILKGLHRSCDEIYVGSGAEMLAPVLKRFFPGLLTRILRQQKIP